MPIYKYKNPDTEETVEVIQGVNDQHAFVDKEGRIWDREFTVPNAAVDTKINEFSAGEFSEKTKDKKGSYGDILDRSKEMSLKRKEKEGRDAVEQKWFDKYGKKRKGRKHRDDPKR